MTCQAELVKMVLVRGLKLVIIIRVNAEVAAVFVRRNDKLFKIVTTEHAIEKGE